MLARYLLRALSSGKVPHASDCIGSITKPIAVCLTEAVARKDKLTVNSYRQNHGAGFTLPAPKELSTIVKLETIKDASKDDIARLWNEYHFKLGRGHVSTVLDGAAFKMLKERTATCPLFVLPLKKPAGFVTMFLQAQMPRLLFTGLEDYKIRGSQASPYLVVTHYDELAESKDIVLVRGDIILPNHLKDAEASDLLEATHSFYLKKELFDHVQAFNKQSADFDFNEVLRTRGIPSL